MYRGEPVRVPPELKTYQTLSSTTPPSTLNEAPVVADACVEHTFGHFLDAGGALDDRTRAMLHDKLGNHRLKGFAGAFDLAFHHVRDAIRQRRPR